MSLTRSRSGNQTATARPAQQVAIPRQRSAISSPPWRRSRPDAPVIKLVGGQLPRAAREGMAALMAAGVGFYQRDKSLVYVTRVPAKDLQGNAILTPGVTRVDAAYLLFELGLAAT